MATSFQNKLNDLEARLKAENAEMSKDPNPRDLSLGLSGSRRPKPLFGELNFSNAKKPSPGALCFSVPGLPGPPNSALQRRRHFQLPGSSPQPQKPPDSHEIEMKYQEIMKASGILTLDGEKVATHIDDLETLGELGHGTCGHVVKMRHRRTGHLMAVKQMRRSGNREENKRIIMDLDVVLKSHDCPYIVQCLGTFITSSDVWICMELMATCLDKLLKKLKESVPEKILGKVAVATVNALNYLKDEHGVIHRDVKPSNILIDEHGRIKLCDFGISGRLVDSKAKTRSAGCAAYMAPERIDPPDPTKPDYDIRADVWSLGISLVELATGEFPYKNCKTDFEVLTKVLQEEPPKLPQGCGFSLHFHMFVRDCLAKDYRRRPKYRKLLEHAFIQRYEKMYVDVARWYAEVMGIQRPKAQIQQPPSYFARSESYTSCRAPTQLVAPLTTPPVDLSISQPNFYSVSPSPCQSDGWPSPQSSTSSRVEFSLSYSPSPSPSPSPSGPFQATELDNQVDNRMDFNAGRSPSFNQQRSVSFGTARHSGISQSKGSDFSMDRGLEFGQGRPTEFTDLRSGDFRQESHMDCSQGRPDLSQIKSVSFSQGRSEDNAMDYNQGNAFSTSDFGVYSRDQGLDLNRSTHSRNNQNNGLVFEGNCHNNPFLTSQPLPAAVRNPGQKPGHVRQTSKSNPFSNNPLNPFSQY